MAEPVWWRLSEAGLQDDIASPEAIAAVRAMPGFQAAMEHSMRGALRLNDLDPIYYRTMNDTALAVLGVLALYLDATGGLWHQRLRDVAGFSGVLSTGRASALLMRMQSIGFVEAEKERAAGTPKFYRPTSRLTAAFRDRLRLELEAMSRIAPDMEEHLARFDAPGGFAAFMREYGKVVLKAVLTPSAPDLPMLAISSRRAGTIALIALVDAASTQAGHFPATGPTRVSVAALARRFGVSRTHVLNLLRAAEAAGFIARDTADGDIEVLPALIDALEELYGLNYISAGASAHLALR
ncbi:MAG: hypothetical protein ABW360_18670 [Phenylobacterium sp.]